MGESYKAKLRWVKNLKDKSNPNDKKMTPEELSKELIEMTPLMKNDLVFDGFYGKGAFYNQYPSYVKKKWTEVDKRYTPNNESRDFFKECDNLIKNKKNVDWVGPTNPPYSKINDIFEKSVKIAKKGIAMLVGIMNISPKRLKLLADNNFGITTYYLCNVRGWFGNVVYFVAEKNKKSIITFTNKIYNMPGIEHKKFIKNQKKYQEKYYKKHFQEKLKDWRKTKTKSKKSKTKKKKIQLKVKDIKN